MNQPQEVIRIAQINGMGRRDFTDYIVWARESDIDVIVAVECSCTGEGEGYEGVRYVKCLKPGTRIGVFIMKEGMKVLFPYVDTHHIVMKMGEPVLMIHAWYAPPDTGTDEERKKVASELLKHLQTRKTRTVHLGDWNARSVELLGDAITCARGSKVAEMLGDWFKVCNTKGVRTFRRANYSSTPDWVVASADIEGKVKWSTVKDIMNSDHDTVLVTMLLKVEEEHKSKKVVKPGKFIKNILKLTVEKPIERWYEAFEMARVRAIEEVSTKPGAQLPENLEYLRGEIIKCSKKLVRGEGNMSEIRDTMTQLVEVYKRSKKAWQSSVKADRLKQADKMTVFKEVVGKCRAKKADHIIHEGERLEGKEAAAKMLETVFPHPSRAELRGESKGRPDLKPITETEIRKVLKMFDKTTAPGKDGVNFKLLYQWFEADPGYWVRLLNDWWTREIFPDELKDCAIVPLVKDVTKLVTGDMIRPIALMTCLSKVYEKIICDRLVFYLESTRNVSNDQHGYREARSAETALEEIQSKRREANEKTEVIVQLDIKGAFTNVKHQAVVDALINYNVPSNITNILKQYLSKRTVSVQIEGEWAEKALNCGVNQGSSLGPRLYALVTNQAADKVREWMEKSVATNSTMVVYADDALMRIASDCELEPTLTVVDRFMGRYKKYLAKAGLTLSTNKTKVMVGGEKYEEKVVKLLGEELKTEPHIKFLGVYLSHDGNYGKHCREVTEKIEGWLADNRAVMMRTSGLGHEERKTLYRQVVAPKVTYGANVWWEEKKRKKKGRGVCPEWKTNNQMMCTLSKKLAQAVAMTSTKAGATAATTLAGVWPLSNQLNYESKVKRIRMDGEYKGVQLAERVTLAQTGHPGDLRVWPYERTIECEQEAAAVQADVTYYTDGSRYMVENETGDQCPVVGAAYVKCKNRCIEKTMRYKLNEYNTVYQAEGLAIREALKDATMEEKGKAIAVLSDSLSMLEAIASELNKEEMVIECRKLLAELEERGGRITLYHVRAHVGIENNERVDQEAKRAAVEGEKIEVKMPMSAVKFELKKAEREKIERDFKADKYGRTVKQFFDGPFEPARKKVRIDQYTADVFTGAGENKESMQFGFKGSGQMCECGRPQTVMHAISECRIYMRGNQAAAAKVKLPQHLLLGEWAELTRHVKFFKYVEERAKSLCEELRVNNMGIIDERSIIIKLKYQCNLTGRATPVARTPPEGEQHEMLAQCYRRQRARRNVNEQLYSDQNNEQMEEEEVQGGEST